MSTRNHDHLARGLKNRHIQMIALGGAIGTGLFYGSAASIQLAGPGSYVPTPRAARGGGYSAIVESNVVGPEGGQALTDRTVELINSLWPEG